MKNKNNNKTEHNSKQPSNNNKLQNYKNLYKSAI